MTTRVWIFLACMAAWLAVSLLLAWLLAKKRFSGRPRWLAFALLLAAFLLAPLADEWAGGWQFRRLCQRQAVAALSPGWQGVKRARVVSAPLHITGWHAVPIEGTQYSYYDQDSGKLFLSYPAFSRKAGFFIRPFLPGGGFHDHCLPANLDALSVMLNLSAPLQDEQQGHQPMPATGRK